MTARDLHSFSFHTDTSAEHTIRMADMVPYRHEACHAQECALLADRAHANRG